MSTRAGKKSSAKKASGSSSAKKPATRKKSLNKRIEDALRTEFTTDTVDVSKGYGDNVHVIVVSRKFDGKSDQERYKLVTDLLDEHADLDDAQKAKITLLLPLSPEELK